MKYEYCLFLVVMLLYKAQGVFVSSKICEIVSYNDVHIMIIIVVFVD